MTISRRAGSLVWLMVALVLAVAFAGIIEQHSRAERFNLDQDTAEHA